MKSKFNRFNLLTFCLTFVIVCMGLSSCGDDDDDNGTAKTDNGVNVVKGRKLVKLDFYPDKTFENPMFSFMVDYDSKGQMRKILLSHFEVDPQYYLPYAYRGYHFYITTDVVMEIDYDLRVITMPHYVFYYFNSYNNAGSLSYGFALNEDGYISQLGNITLKYDSNGYLASVDSPEGLSTLSFNNDDYLKASISGIKSGNMQLYYASFGDINDKGELYVRIGGKSLKNFLPLGNVFKKVICLIAYQSGLFGKVSQSFLHFKDEKEANMFFDYGDNANMVDGKIYFEFE